MNIMLICFIFKQHTGVLISP